MRCMRPARFVSAVGETRTQRLLSVLACALGAAIVVFELRGDDDLAGAGLAVMLTAVLLVQFDVRRRLGPLAERVKAHSQEFKRLASVSRPVAPPPPAPVKQIDPAELRRLLVAIETAQVKPAELRRLLTAIEAGRLEAFDRHTETVEALDRLRRSAVS